MTIGHIIQRKMSNRLDKTIPELTTEELVQIFKECSAVAQSLMLNMCIEETTACAHMLADQFMI